MPIHKITEQEGLKAAQAFSGMEALEPGSHSDGQLPFYQYVGKIEDRDVEVSVTKQGGQILYYFVSTNADGLTILPTQAREKEVRAAAQAFLQAKGYPACQESYIQYYNGCALIHMVPIDVYKRQILPFPRYSAIISAASGILRCSGCATAC